MVAVVAVAVVDDEDGIQWWWWGGGSMAAEVFDGGVDGLRIGNVEAKMVIDTSGGGWRQRASAFDSGDGRRWPLVFDDGDRRLLWQQLAVDNRYGIQWWRWWWLSMVVAACEGV